MFGMHRDRLREHAKPARRQTILQIFWTVLLNGYTAGFTKQRIFTGKTKAFCIPVLNCYSCPGALGSCPVGSLQAMLGRGKFPFYVLGSITLFGVLLGRLVCGIMCPFGFVQDLLHRIPVPKLKMPKKTDRMLRYLKYVVLLCVILLPAAASGGSGIVPPYFCKYICPAGTLQGGIPHMLMNGQLRELAGALFGWKMGVMFVILVLAMTVHRPFCKYLCPLGAFYSVFNRFSFYQLQVDEKKCVQCGACERVCPMQVEVTKHPNDPECIRCGRCRAACPTDAIRAGVKMQPTEDQ